VQRFEGVALVKKPSGSRREKEAILSFRVSAQNLCQGLRDIDEPATIYVWQHCLDRWILPNFADELLLNVERRRSAPRYREAGRERAQYWPGGSAITDARTTMIAVMVALPRKPSSASMFRVHAPVPLA
jgi:hypothetical protein